MNPNFSKSSFINEMKAHAFDMVADPKVGNDKTAVLNSFIHTLTYVLCREAETSDCKPDYAFEQFIADLKGIGIEAEVHVIDLPYKHD